MKRSNSRRVNNKSRANLPKDEQLRSTCRANQSINSSCVISGTSRTLPAMSFPLNRNRREAASLLQNVEYNDLTGDQSIEETFQKQPSEKHTIGKRTGVTLPPRGTIPVNDDGYEDFDAFWDAAKSPNPNSAKKPSSREIKEAKRRERQ